MKYTPEQLDAVRARVSPADLAERHGVKLRARGRGRAGLCPLHVEKTPSFHVEGDRFRCYGCGAYGDVFDLEMRLSGITFRQAVEALSGDTVLHSAAPGSGPRAGKSKRRRTPKRKRPPLKLMASIWGKTIPIHESPAARAYLTKIGANPARLSSEGVFGVLPAGTVLPRAARVNGHPWSATEVLLAKLRGPDGKAVSLLGRPLGKPPEGMSKSFTPAGYLSSRLVLMNGTAHRAVAGQGRHTPPWGGADPDPSIRRLIIAEGEKKFAIHVSRISDACEGVAVIGVRSGSWNERSSFVRLVPEGAGVYIATDPDTAGARYATAIVRSLERRWRAGAVTIELRPGHAISTAPDGRVRVECVAGAGAPT